MTARTAHDARPGVADLLSALQRGERSAESVVIQRRGLAESQPGLNAIIAPDWERAMAAARSVDRRRRAGDEVGALAGIPFTVKDVIAVAGRPITAGSRAFADTVATTTAPAVQRLLDADAILLGKTNCPEFAFGTACANELFGETANPRFPGRSPGGSSGGEAAAVAAGVSSLGIGTDYGGSLRWPAQCTGLVALRPTVGAVDPTGQVPGFRGSLGRDSEAYASPLSLQGQTQVIGPIAASVADLRLALTLLRTTAAHAAPATGPLRIGWADGLGIGPVRGEIVAALRMASERLAGVGHDVTEYPKAFAGCLDAFNALRAVDPARDHFAAIGDRRELVSAGALATISATLGADPDTVADAWLVALEARRAALQAFRDVDVLLIPVAGGPACWPDASVDIDGVRVEGFDLMAHCRAVSLTGAPVVSVPVAATVEGLPISVQVVAAPGQDELALRVAGELESLPI